MTITMKGGVGGSWFRWRVSTCRMTPMGRACEQKSRKVSEIELATALSHRWCLGTVGHGNNPRGADNLKWLRVCIMDPAKCCVPGDGCPLPPSAPPLAVPSPPPITLPLPPFPSSSAAVAFLPAQASPPPPRPWSPARPFSSATSHKPAPPGRLSVWWSAANNDNYVVASAAGINDARKRGYSLDNHDDGVASGRGVQQKWVWVLP